ncbi:MAG: ABC transporter substrate-binding protein [Thalassobaculaceae bacterium]|nr:ABC transporter substrate-binding protein [Thalassobaculaceae bacterium]
MKFRTMAIAAASAAAMVAGAGFATVAAAYEYTVPNLVYRTGPYAPNGIPLANGFIDYMNMLNERDGGIDGVKVNVIECETGYNTKVSVECYENLKNEGESGALIFNPHSTGVTYALIPKATADEIPILSMGYGRTSAADGTVFPYIFNFPATYWSQASVFVKYVGAKEGGMDNLKGKKIALVYHNSAYGKEPIKTLEVLAEKYGFELMLLPVDHPGQEQKATWLQVRRGKPDWVFMWGWGVMNQVAIKEAAAIRFPMDHFIGVWWSGSENDVAPAGDAADGYLAGTMHAPGRDFGAIKDIITHVYDKGNGGGDLDRVGEVLYNRGMLEAIFTAQAIRNAVKIHGTKEINGKQLRDGLEVLTVTEESLSADGLSNFMKPFKVTCEDHEGAGLIAIQQWNAKDQKWVLVSDWIEPMTDIVRGLVKEDAGAFAKENNITPRSCS